MLESLFDKFAGLTPVLKNICQWLLLYCTRTTRCYLSVLPFIEHLQKQPLEVFCEKKVFLESSLKDCNFIKKETLAQVFSSEFCEVSKYRRSCRTHTDDCFCTFFLIITATTIIFLIFFFHSNSKGFKELESGISFSLSHFHWFYFLFPCFFCLSQFCFIFLAAANKSNSFKLRID